MQQSEKSQPNQSQHSQKSQTQQLQQPNHLDKRVSFAVEESGAKPDGDQVYHTRSGRSVRRPTKFKSFLT
ncbi:Uncharacterised protein r2_g2878 [Pycnogonum litorale]